MENACSTGSCSQIFKNKLKWKNSWVNYLGDLQRWEATMRCVARIVRERGSRQKSFAGEVKLSLERSKRYSYQEVWSEMFHCVAHGSVKTLRVFLTFKKSISTSNMKSHIRLPLIMHNPLMSCCAVLSFSP